MNIYPASEQFSDILVIEPKVFSDARGFFMETYQAQRYAGAGIPTDFVQDNHSGSRGGALRGLHYQIRQAQGKLVRVIAGEVFDVAVDLRRQSPNFGRWFGIHLSAENKKHLWIPQGYAHGFYVLSDWCEILYKTTDYYAPQWERTLAWDDPDIAIPWPVTDRYPLLISAKDAQGVRLAQADLFPPPE